MNLAHRLPTQTVTVLPPVTTDARAVVAGPRTGASAPVSDADARKRRPGSGVACLVLLGLTVGALAHVAVHLKHLEVGLQLGEARKDRSRLEEQRRQLVLEVGVLKDPVRVMEVARNKLGLAPPSASDIVPIKQLRARITARMVEGTQKVEQQAADKAAASSKTSDDVGQENL